MKLYRKWLRDARGYSRIWVCLQRVVLYQLSTWHNPKRKRKQGGVLPGHKNPVTYFVSQDKMPLKRHFECPESSSCTVSKKQKTSNLKLFFSLSRSGAESHIVVGEVSWSVIWAMFIVAGKTNNSQQDCRASLMQAPNACWCCECRDV